MTTAFLSGSRKITRLNDMVRSRLHGMIKRNFRIVVGDANGADKAFQRFLADHQYENVQVFHAGPECRNNLGRWSARAIGVDPKLKGRDFYVQKDKAMAAKADCGLVLWDGKSAGSIDNVLQLLKRRKPTSVYVAPEKTFLEVSELRDLEALMAFCERTDYAKISRKIGLVRQLTELREPVQGALF